MNTKTLLIGLIVVIVIVIGIVMLSGRQDSVSLENDMIDGTITPTPSSGSVLAGSYEPYSPEKVARADEGDVVLFFRASWCPTCRAVDADIKAHLDNIPVNLTILDVDYDSSTELKKKYGVVYQHTFVQVDAQGNLLKKWSGSPTLAALVAQVQ